MKFSKLSASFLLVVMSTLVSAMYGPESGVFNLDMDNFNKFVKESDGIWIVEFFAPWCGHCQQLAPEYQKAAQALKGLIHLAAVDCDQHSSLCGQFHVQGFPTIKIFGSDKENPENFNGERTSGGIVQAAQSAALKLVQDRLSGRSPGGGSASKSDVAELTDSNFAQLVLQSEDSWLVEFFAPWCGHCQSLKPHWEKAATELKGKVKLGAMDATMYGSFAQQYRVQGYPTIKYFPSGVRSEPEEYTGGRTSSDIVSWALDKQAESMSIPEVLQITSNEVIMSNCENNSLCIVTFLPSLLDCQSKCRTQYIVMLNNLAQSFKSQGWGWIWTEGTVHPALEHVLDIGGFGYPAMSVISAKKMKHSLLTGSFSFKGIQEFLNELASGKGRTNPIKGAKLPLLSSIDPWDGKDAEMPLEENLDVSEIILDAPMQNIEL